MDLFDVVKFVGTAALLVAMIRIILLFFIARIRLTDWLGYTVCVGGIFSIGVFLITGYGLLGLSACIAAKALGTVGSFRDAHRFKTDQGSKLAGSFVFGKAPDRVSNWPIS